MLLAEHRCQTCSLTQKAQSSKGQRDRFRESSRLGFNKGEIAPEGKCGLFLFLFLHPALNHVEECLLLMLITNVDVSCSIG